MDKLKKKGITWGEAAKMVLEHAPHPLTHKEILQAILDKNLKEVNLKFSQALACLNAMLHANSRTPTGLFHKIGGRSCCYKLNENRIELQDTSDSDSESPGSILNDALSEVKEATPANDSQSARTTPQFVGLMSGSASASSGSLPPISSILGSYHSQAISTSVSSSIACAIADSRLSSLIAPTPETPPLRSALSKKRSVKPCFDTPSKKPRVTFKLDKEKKGKAERPSKPPVKTKAELKYMEDDSASKNFIPPVLRPPMYPTHTVVKNSSSGYFGQKKHKKMSLAAQVKRSKEGQVDLVSPDSILSKINGRMLINFRTFNLLPKHYQYHLVKLLPKVDQETGSKGELRPSATAFSNEFFTSAFESWKERLSEGEFTPEMTQKIQQEQEKVFNQDPWKTKHFESVWGEKLLEKECYVSPVEKSHQIMEEVLAKWKKEQEDLEKEKQEEKLREMENTDLSAPNKIKNKSNECEKQPVKNLTAKQKAASVRQQKLSKAKGMTSKAVKKSSDGKSVKSGKSSSKDVRDGKNSEKHTKSQISRNSKPNKIKSEASKKEIDTVRDIGNLSSQVPTVMTEVEIAALEQKITTVEVTQSSTPQSPSLLSKSIKDQPLVKDTTAKKARTAKKKEAKVKVEKATNNALGYPCMCVLKPMVMCRRCGAFCHSDCISPMSICAACVA